MRLRNALVVALMVASSACTRDHGPAVFQPTFESIDCPVEVSSVMLVEISCGTLTVPAHHDRPGEGTLELFVARMTPGAETAPDPVLSLGGDLGVSTDYVTLSAQLEGLGRELITLEARGTGRSTPSLVCPEIEGLPHAPVESPLDSARTRREFLRAVGTCHDRLTSQGVDLTAFDLREMAADAEDLRVALGINRWNVMALGTTARIALEYVRNFPEHLRAVVLDSAEWPGVDPVVESIEGTRYAIEQLVASCRAATSCQRIAPNVDRNVIDLLQRFDKRPVVADAAEVPDLGQRGKVLFDGGWFAVWLRARLAFIRPPGTFVPNALADLATGSPDAVAVQAARLLDRQLCQGFLPSPCWPQLVMSWGVHLSVLCRDVLPFTDRTQVGELVAGDPSLSEAFARGPHTEACGAWAAGQGDPTVAQPVGSDVPVLVIVGRFDPFGSLPYAEQGTAALTNSHIVVSPVSGRLVTGTVQLEPDACLVQIRDAWIDDPGTQPDTSCMEELVIDFGLDPAYRM